MMASLQYELVHAHSRCWCTHVHMHVLRLSTATVHNADCCVLNALYVLRHCSADFPGPLCLQVSMRSVGNDVHATLTGC